MEKKTIDALRWIVGILNKHQIPFQISGGFAAKLYGSPRPLNDIDIDLSEKFFPILMPEIAEHVTYGPARFKDGKWDLELTTLNYKGQQIDLSGADDARISNMGRSAWIPFQTDMDKSISINVDGIDIRVMHPRSLTAYKRELDGEHQQLDIASAEKYA